MGPLVHGASEFTATAVLLLAQASAWTGGAVSNAYDNPGLVSDCEALLESRDTLTGTGTSLNWSANTPMSAWDGITVEGTPARGTEISLQNRGLRGTIPTQLGSLSELKTLRLDTTLEVCQGDDCRDTLQHEQNRLTVRFRQSWQVLPSSSR